MKKLLTIILAVTIVASTAIFGTGVGVSAEKTIIARENIWSNVNWSKTDGWRGTDVNLGNINGAFKIDANGLTVDTTGFTFDSQMVQSGLGVNKIKLKELITAAKENNAKIEFDITLVSALKKGDASTTVKVTLMIGETKLLYEIPITGTHHFEIDPDLFDATNLPDYGMLNIMAGEWNSGFTFVNLEVSPMIVYGTESPVIIRTSGAQALTIHKESPVSFKQGSNNYQIPDQYGNEATENKMIMSTVNAEANTTTQIRADLENFSALYDLAVAGGYNRIAVDMLVEYTAGTSAQLKLGYNYTPLVADKQAPKPEAGTGVVTFSFSLDQWNRDVNNLHIWAMSYHAGAYSGNIYMSVPYIEGYVAPPTVKIDNQLVQTGGEQFTFPASTEKGFIAYTDNTNYYDVGDTVAIDKNLEFTTVAIGEVKMLEGASIRLAQKSGIRFETQVDATALANLPTGSTVEKGTLITLKELATSDLTLNSDYKTVNVKYLADEYRENGTFAGSIVNIQDKNITKDFVGRGYVTVKIGEYTKTVYADYANNRIEDNSRSVAYIANAYKTSCIDEYNNLIGEQKTLVENWSNAYINSLK